MAASGEIGARRARLDVARLRPAGAIVRHVIDGRKRLLLALGVTICLGGALVLAAGLLAALPALLAFLPLLAGHYAGAGRLERAITARLAAPA